MQNPAATEAPEPRIEELRIFQPGGLAVTIGLSEPLEPLAQAIVNRVNPVLCR